MPDVAAPLAHIRSYIERHWDTFETPGMAVGLTDRERTLGVVTHGYAHLAAGTPVSTEHLFQIGSISKSFTAIAVLQEHEAGRIDLHAPVTTYLPWFEVGSRFGPITIHHLLTHTSGLTTGRDFTTEGLHEVWALRDTEVGFAPGERYHYSNAGYKALGLILEAVSGRPWWELVRERILDPLGMSATDPLTTYETRGRSAAGHGPPSDDRPRHARYGFAEQPWVESATADGTICSTAEDMTAFCRMLLAGGRPVLPGEGFTLLTQRATPDPEHRGEFYGYGLVVGDVDGHARIHHTGSTVGFSAWMGVDVDDGTGVVILTNAYSVRHELSEFAFLTLRAARNGEELPPIPEPKGREVVEDAEAYAGVYRSEHGQLVLDAEGGRLLLRHRGEAVPLARDVDDRFVVPDPDFELFALRFQREREVVTHAVHGSRWWANERYEGPVAFPHDAQLDAVVGHYRTHNPWYPNFRVVARMGALHLLPGWSTEDWELVPLAGGRFRAGAEEWSPRRVRFDTVIDGKATRAILDRAPYYRTFTP